MPITLLYNEKTLPLKEAVSLYEQAFRPSLLADEIKVINSRLRYKEPAREDLTDWYSLENNLYFTKAYVSIFHTPQPNLPIWISWQTNRIRCEVPCCSLLLRYEFLVPKNPLSHLVSRPATCL